MKSPERPILRYFGGKWRLAPWIIQNMPEHRIYVEPFGGAASVLLQKPRAHTEIYNDIHGIIVNVFRVLQNPSTAKELERLLRLTPWSREEFLVAIKDSENPIESARRTIIRSFMGHSAERTGKLESRNGFRAANGKSGRDPAQDWINFPDQIERFTERLMGVTIENADAFDLIKKYDTIHTLFYIDPPYVPETRKSGAYQHEFEAQDHATLIKLLKDCSGMVLLNGYDSDLYQTELSGWNVMKQEAHTNGNKHRVEVLWINEAAWRARSQLELAL